MWNFVYWLVAQIVVELILPKPKPDKPRPYSLNDFTYPTNDETRPIPMGWGTFKQPGSLIWKGDLKIVEATTSVSTGLFSKSDQTLGYQYYLGMWFTLNAAPVDELVEIRLGDRIVWQGNQVLSKSTVTSIDVSASWEENQGQVLLGGIQGRFIFFNQLADVSDTEWAPLVNSYMESQVGVGNVPAYPNICHAVWLGPSSDPSNGFITISNRIDPLNFVFRRKPDLSDALNTSQDLSWPIEGSLSNPLVKSQLQTWIDSRSMTANGDANPELIKLEVLTSQTPGIGPRLSGDAIQLESFLRTAERVHSEGLGASFTWDNTRPVQNLIDDLNNLSSGFVELDEKTGRLRTKIARADDVPAYTFDNDNIIEILSFTRASIDEAPNEVAVPFIDRQMNWEPRQHRVQNEAGIRASGTVITETAEFIGVSNSITAAILASRSVASVSAAGLRASWTAFIDQTQYLPRPGDLVRLVHPKYGTYRMRLTSVRFSNFENRLTVELDAVQDLFRNGDASTAYTPTPPANTDSTPTPNNQSGQVFATVAPLGLLSGRRGDYLMVGVAPANETQQSYVDIAFVEGLNVQIPARSDRGTRYALSTWGVISGGVPSNTGTITCVTNAANVGAIRRQLASLPAEIIAVLGYSMSFSGNSQIGTHEFISVRSDTIQIINETTFTFQLARRGLFDTVPAQAWTQVMLLPEYAIDSADSQSFLRPFIDEPIDPVLTFDGKDFFRADHRYRNGGKAATWSGTSVAGQVPANASFARARRPALPARVLVNGAQGALSAAAGFMATIQQGSPMTVSWKSRGYGASFASFFDHPGTNDPTIKHEVFVFTKPPGTSVWTAHASVVSNGNTATVPSLVGVPSNSVMGVCVIPYYFVDITDKDGNVVDRQRIYAGVSRNLESYLLSDTGIMQFYRLN